MTALAPDRIAELLTPYTPAPAPELCGQLALYLDLILKWNERTNLTAIRTPDDIVRRHFGESLFAASHLDPAATLLDFGSGAGFPGLPIQLLHPGLHVTLAESQGKKASFLREAVRTLALPTEIWPHRVESMADNRTFDAITLRAVDQMDLAIQTALPRSNRRLLIFGTTIKPISSILYDKFNETNTIPVPESTTSVLRLFDRR